MLIVVLTTTRQYGGLDVTANVLRRQQEVRLDDLIWVVGDELYKERQGIFKKYAPELNVRHFDTTKYREREPHLRKTYVHAYQDALLLARRLDADLFVSLQDYIVPPDDGIARFAAMNQATPDALFTGLMSHVSTPAPEEVADLKGLWTIFEEPYEGRPSTDDIYWQDVRNKGPGIHPTEAAWFESNWSAIGKGALHDQRLYYDVEFDMGIAYENMDFAMRALQHGYPTIMDCDNHALGLPHKRYFPWQEVEEAQINQENRERYERRWLCG